MTGAPPVLVEPGADGVLRITLNLEETRNSLRPDLVAALTGAFAGPAAEPTTRAVVLTGVGTVFCSGGDVGSMTEIAGYSFEENLADSAAMDAMFRTVDECPAPLVARVNGPAMGGGAGLVACADVAVAVEGARFALSEVRFGIIPAVVGTYVVPKIGVGWARRLLVTGERFDAARALQIGLVHEVVAPEALDSAVDAVLEQVLAARPGAQRTIKAHLRRIATGQLATRDEVAAVAVEAAARARMSDEGRAGLSAFVDRR
jgi:methylglutaconyl-CoA hydratase